MLLVTGATGQVGRELVRALTGAPLRTMSRTAAPSENHVVADLDDPFSLARAFDGIDRMFLLTPGIGIAQTVNALDAARRAGVSYIVHLSSANVLGDPMPAMGRWHHEREELVRASGIPATVLRPGGFMTNALEWAATIRTGGYVLDPVGPGRFAPIDPADVADVAAKILEPSLSKPPSQVPWPLPRQPRKPSGRDGTTPAEPTKTAPQGPSPHPSTADTPHPPNNADRPVADGPAGRSGGDGSADRSGGDGSGSRSGGDGSGDRSGRHGSGGLSAGNVSQRAGDADGPGDGSGSHSGNEGSGRRGAGPAGRDGAGSRTAGGASAYTLTGGEALTVAEQVHILARVLGRELEVRTAATAQEAVRSRFPYGAPQALTDALTEAFALMRADTTGLVTSTVHDLTGHAPRTFADWCARNAAAFSA